MPSHSEPGLLGLLQGMAAAEASDLHLVPGNQPMYRVHGELRPAAANAVALREIEDLLLRLAPAETREQIDRQTDADFAVQLEGTGGTKRFRVNVFSARGARGICVRAIPQIIPSLADLGFPAELGDRIAALNGGLVLVTGVTGSGKTTSIAAMLQILNARGNCRIITVEQPIEYLYPAAGTSIVTQREVGVDVASFADGLRSGLRQDPDVLLVGEIRDRETAQLALSAAETGHLIFGTLHSADAKGAISRMVDLFPSDLHDDVRAQLSMSLQFVIAQHLLSPAAGGRRVLAMEVLHANFGVRSAIRLGRMETIETAIQSGRKEGMYTLDVDLRRLVEARRITLETARAFAKDPAEFR